MRHQWIGAAALTMGLLLAGCAGLHLHSEEDAKLAAQAKDDYVKIDSLALFASVRTNLQKLHDAEIVQVRENLEYLRDLTLFDLAAAKAEGDAKSPADGKKVLADAMSLEETAACKSTRFPRQGLCAVQRRVAEMGFAKKQDLIDAMNRFEKGPLGTNWARELADSLQTLTGWDVPACNRLPPAIPEGKLQQLQGMARLSAEAQFKTLGERCKDPDLKEVLALLAPLPRETELGAAAAQILSAEQVLEDIEKDKKAIKGKLEALKAKIASALAEQGPDAEKRKKELIDEVRALRGVINKVTDATKRIGFLKGLAESQIESLDILLAAAEGEEVPEAKLNGDEDLRKAALVAQSIPGLAAEIGAALGRLRAPPTASLLIAKGQALVDEQDAKAREALVNRRLLLYRANLRALLNEASLLKEANDKANEPCSGKACDAYALRAYFFLSRSFVPARLESQITKWDDIQLDAEVIVQANEYALRSWDNLVRTPLDVLQAYHAGGIKPAELADLIIKAGGVGLLAIIAGRVN